MLATNLKVHNKQQQKRTLRLLAVARYKQKKLDRKNQPVIRYTSRKKIADCRPRVKGRFVGTGKTKIQASLQANGFEQNRREQAPARAV